VTWGVFFLHTGIQVDRWLVEGVDAWRLILRGYPITYGIAELSCSVMGLVASVEDSMAVISLLKRCQSKGGHLFSHIICPFPIWKPNPTLMMSACYVKLVSCSEERAQLEMNNCS
jgi:hypothetical protein